MITRGDRERRCLYDCIYLSYRRGYRIAEERCRCALCRIKRTTLFHTRGTEYTININNQNFGADTAGALEVYLELNGYFGNVQHCFDNNKVGWGMVDAFDYTHLNNLLGARFVNLVRHTLFLVVLVISVRHPPRAPMTFMGGNQKMRGVCRVLWVSDVSLGAWPIAPPISEKRGEA